MKPEFVDNRNGDTMLAALRHLMCRDKRLAGWTGIAL